MINIRPSAEEFRGIAHLTGHQRNDDHDQKTLGKKTMLDTIIIMTELTFLGVLTFPLAATALYVAFGVDIRRADAVTATEPAPAPEPLVTAATAAARIVRPTANANIAVIAVCVDGDEDEDLAKLATRQLKAKASKAKIKNYSRMSKAQLISALSK